MKREFSLLKKILYSLLLFIFLASIFASFNLYKPLQKNKVTKSLTDEVTLLKSDGLSFRDLNKNNLLDAYEDHRLSSEIRVNDLLARMTTEEKVGQMFHPPFTLNPDLLMMIYEIAIRGNKLTEAKIVFDNITHFNLYGNPSPSELAKKINYFQQIASKTRLGIPITISSDPFMRFLKVEALLHFL